VRGFITQLINIIPEKALKIIMTDHGLIKEYCIYWGFISAGVKRNFLYKFFKYVGRFSKEHLLRNLVVK
jgi:hypothetical protein